MKARQTDGVAVAAAKASFGKSTAYLLEGEGQSAPRPSQVRGRRRPDPLIDIFDAEVVPMLKAAPGLRAVGIFRELERRHPSLDPGVRRTLERRIRMLGKDLLTAHGSAVKLEDKFKALKMIAVGYGMERMGQGILSFLGKSIDASKDYTSQLSLMNAAGMSQRDIAEATAAAWKTSSTVLTSTAADSLKSIRELRTVFFGNMGEAYAVLPAVQRAKGIMEALTGKEQDNVAFDMVKAIERRTTGQMTSAGMSRNIELMSRSLMAFSGTITANDFHGALSRAKTNALGYSDDFIYNYLPTLMQINKGGGSGGAQQAGTQLATASRAIIQGHILKSMIPMWEEMRLIGAGDIVKTGTGGLQIRPGRVAGARLFGENPFLWANEVLAPQAKAYAAAHHMDLNQVLLSMFGDRNASSVIGGFILQAAQYRRDRDMVTKGGGSYEAYQKLLNQNPQVAEMALHAQMQNVLSIIGYQILPKILPLMVKLAGTLNEVGMALYRHPLRTEAVVVGLTALGGALDIMGKVMMTAGIIKFLGIGPLVAGALAPVGLTLAGIGIAAWLVYNNWKEIKGSLITMWSEIRTGFKQLFSGDILGALKSFGHAWLMSWQVLFNTVIAGLNSVLPSAMAIGKFHFADPSAPNVVPHAGKAIVIHNHMYVDGKDLGKVVTPHVLANMTKLASGPNRGVSGFDARRHPMYTSMASR